ncbi:protein FAR1-RELATED SEQUENCE 5-like [Henckelia pumila]|uniref:protein FAR1-RELATED SEQUENCE 5-like n=1 Tax=Henckelia pumila TaxID=405737 RepID=UPI003C6E179F
MAADGQKYLLRSARKVLFAQGETLKAMSNAGIKPSNALSYMENESRGVENLGFTRKDAYNYLNQATKGHLRVENGDAFELIRYFKTKSNDGDLFYWDIEMDEDGRLSSFFFRDNRARIDYEFFGDVISFDTTYRTNKYNLICAPFVGINHHMDNVMFGLAFISDETVASLEWLFKTFLESMGGKQPETIFTDQCRSMMNAIESIFPCSQHRLCQWHISKNAPSHLGSLNTNYIFKGMFTRCMQFCESELEFNEVWRKMIDDFGLEEHSWLSGMYKLRHKWSTAFSIGKFSAGLKATSRSEGTNAILKDGGKRTSTLSEFVQKFEIFQKHWRMKENEEDFKCHHKMPTIVVKNQPLLQHAASIYTIEIYKIFENELVNSLNIEFACPPSFMENRCEYRIRSLGQSKRIRSVKFDMQTNEVSCSCHHFETVGVLCKHALIVLKFMNVHQIPKKYIKLRWTKGVRDIVQCNEKFVANCRYESDMVYRNETMRLCYELTTKSAVHIDLKRLMRTRLQSLALEMNEMLESLKNNDELNDKESIGIGGFVLEKDKLVNHISNIDEVVVCDPIFVKSKGTSNTCMPSHWNSKKRKNKEISHNGWSFQFHNASTHSLMHMGQDLHDNFSEFTQHMSQDAHNSFQDDWGIN